MTGLSKQLTAVIGIVRRTPQGVPKQQAELLARQLANGVPADMIKRQIDLMAG